MEEILRDLIKTTLEKGPKKQFYSNLSVTKPIHDHVELQSRLSDAAHYLQDVFHSEEGFQSQLYTNRNCAIECNRVDECFVTSPNKEILTSVLALDLLFDNYDEEFLLSELQERFTSNVHDSLIDFIVPSCGISTFNLFKTPSPPSRSSGFEDDDNPPAEDCDSGNESPTSMQSHNEATFTPANFPDDINTSMMALRVLLKQEILQPKPAESVVRWIISNTLSFCEDSVSKDGDGDNEEETGSKVKFPTFITGHGGPDPVSIANFLGLLYTLNVSHEVILGSCEEFLVMTLKNAIATLNFQLLPPHVSEVAPEASTKTLEEPLMSVGNTTRILSSSDNENQSVVYGSSEEAPQAFILHHSPDSLLYFLSRSLAIALASQNMQESSISELKILLLDLLDVRLGASVDTCDVAMRILAAANLGVMDINDTKSVHFLRVNNLLQKEFELLISLQSEDGSWPPDSVVKLGFEKNYDNECGRWDRGAGCDDERSSLSYGYLGGKSLATIFAVRAIATYMSKKKESMLVGDTEFEIGTQQVESGERDIYAHYLY